MSEFLTLVFVALLGFLAPMVARRLKAPVVVSEILLGMIVGGLAFAYRHFYGAEALQTGEALAFLAEIGFIILLFLAGLEIDFNKLEDRGVIPVLLGLLVFVLTLGVAYLVVDQWGGAFLDRPTTGEKFFASLVLSTTSVGIVVPTLREMRIAQSGFGQNVIITALIADFGTMLLLTIYSLGVEVGFGERGGGVPLQWLLIPLFFAIFYLVYRLGGLLMWHRPEALSKFFRSEDPMERGVRGSLALMFAFVFLSDLLGVEVILGAFLAGTMISLLFRQSTLLDEKLYGIGYGFFIPIFFIHLGMNFDFGAVGDRSALVILPGLVLAGLLIKVLPSLVWIPTYGVRRVLAMGTVNASRLTLMIAAASIGVRYGIITETVYSAIIVLAIVSSSLGPVLFRLIMRNDPLAHGGGEEDEIIQRGARDETPGIPKDMFASDLVAHAEDGAPSPDNDRREDGTKEASS